MSVSPTSKPSPLPSPLPPARDVRRPRPANLSPAETHSSFLLPTSTSTTTIRLFKNDICHPLPQLHRRQVRPSPSSRRTSHHPHHHRGTAPFHGGRKSSTHLAFHGGGIVRRTSKARGMGNDDLCDVCGIVGVDDVCFGVCAGYVHQDGECSVVPVVRV